MVTGYMKSVYVNEYRSTALPRMGNIAADDLKDDGYQRILEFVGMCRSGCLSNTTD